MHPLKQRILDALLVKAPPVISLGVPKNATASLCSILLGVLVCTCGTHLILSMYVCAICIIYSIEGQLICQITDRGPRDEVGYLAYQPPFYAVYYMSDGCDVTAHHYRENCQFPLRGHLAG